MSPASWSGSPRCPGRAPKRESWKVYGRFIYQCVSFQFLNYEEILGAGGSGVPAAGQEEVKDTATVILTGFDADKKIAVLKKVREYIEMGLLEAKNFVESLPKPVKEDIDKEDAEAVKKALEEAGGTVQLKWTI